MECESEGKISYDHAIEIAATSQNSLAGESRGKWQTVARVNLGSEILGGEVLFNKVFKKELAATLGAHHLWQLSVLNATSSNQ